MLQGYDKVALEQEKIAGIAILVRRAFKDAMYSEIKKLFAEIHSDRMKEQLVSYNNYEIFARAMKEGSIAIAELCIHCCRTPTIKAAMMHETCRAAFFHYVCLSGEPVGQKFVKFILAHLKDDNRYILDHLFSVLKVWQIPTIASPSSIPGFSKAPIPDGIRTHPLCITLGNDKYTEAYLPRCWWAFTYFEEGSELRMDIMLLRGLIKEGYKYYLMDEFEYRKTQVHRPQLISFSEMIAVPMELFDDGVEMDTSSSPSSSSSSSSSSSYVPVPSSIGLLPDESSASVSNLFLSSSAVPEAELGSAVITINANGMELSAVETQTDKRVCSGCLVM